MLAVKGTGTARCRCSARSSPAGTASSTAALWRPTTPASGRTTRGRTSATSTRQGPAYPSYPALPSHLVSSTLCPAALSQASVGSGSINALLLQVVREGTPCHLYFDLEYVPEHNPGFDGPAMVLVLVERVRQAMW